MAGNKDIPRQLSIYINDREVVNSLGGITREIGKVNGQMRALNKGSETYDQDLKKLKGTLTELKTRQSDFKNEIAETNVVAGDAREQLSMMFSGLTSGNLAQAKEGLMGVRSAVSGLVQTSAAFIATPIGAAIAVLAGIFIATKEVISFNKEMGTLNKILTSFGVATDQLVNVRSEILATAETFDKEFEEIAERANSLSKAYGISMSEANQIITDGLANGGAQNKEFLDSLGEYDEFFSKAGYSAKEFVDIVNTGYDYGIYSDKLPDALKEADLALKEQTKATRDALQNAFGASFTDEILAKVGSGTITTKQALVEIAEQSKITGLTQQQQAQLTADVFKGAGEDAGGAMNIFNALTDASTRAMSEMANAQVELQKSSADINKAMSDLIGIDGFDQMWIRIKTGFNNLFSGVMDYLVMLRNGFNALVNVIQNSFINVFNTILTFASALVSKISPLLKALGVDVDALQKKIEGMKGKNIKFTIETSTTETSKGGKNDAADAAAAEAALKESLRKQAAIRAEERAKEEAKRKAAADKLKAEQEKARKEEFDRLIAFANAKLDLAKAELDNYAAFNRSKIDNDKRLTPEIIAEETRRLQQIKQMQLDAIAQDKAIKIQRAEFEITDKKLLAERMAIIDLETATAKQNLEVTFHQTTDGLKKQYDAEQKALLQQQLQADNELALLEAQTKFEEDAIKRQQDYDTKIAELRTFKEKEIITEAEFNRFKKKLDEEEVKAEEAAIIQKTSAQLTEMGKLADATVALFGQSKAAASATALINGGLAVTQILATPSVLPEPAASISRFIQIAAAGATTIKSIAQINSAKAPKRAKFFYGGYTGSSPAMGFDQYGPMTGVVHANEWVAPEAMTQSPRYARTIGWLESERQKIAGNKYYTGGPTSPGTVPPVNGTENNEITEMTAVLRELRAVLQSGIIAKAVIGYKEAEDIDTLNTERLNSQDSGNIR